MIQFDKIKGILCDMDGVIYHGSKILPGVPEFIEWLKERELPFLFLTNNPVYTPRELSQR